MASTHLSVQVSQEKGQQEREYQGIPPEVLEKLERWKKLPYEEKVAKMREILKWFMDQAREKGESVAALMFMRWVTTPDVAIVLPWMWKPEYREVMTDAILKAAELTEKLVNVMRPLLSRR